MKEKEIINLIKNITSSSYIGDDCAYLENLDIVVTQDSLVEDVHFSLKYSTPYQIGFKSAMVNVSDICASGAEPLYATVALSMPDKTDYKFVEDFYRGLKDAFKNVKIAGGDITGSDKLYISITVIGSAKNRRISTRSGAKEGYKIIVSGEHGNSAKGLEILKSTKLSSKNEKFINAHLMPNAKLRFSKEIAENIKDEYAMTDSSDGLADALMNIAKSSGVTLDIDTSKIPHDKNVDMDTVLYGGEDYELVACVPESILKYITKYYLIGDVKKGNAGIILDNIFIDNIDDKIFNHFKSKNV